MQSISQIEAHFLARVEQLATLRLEGKEIPDSNSGVVLVSLAIHGAITPDHIIEAELDDLKLEEWGLFLGYAYIYSNYEECDPMQKQNLREIYKTIRSKLRKFYNQKDRT